ncbi:MAG: carboxypeptidase regulatory-like domain-containing protein [Pseudomonadota bacterium]
MTVRTWILRALALSFLALSLPAWAIEGGLAIDVIDAETRRPLAGVTLRVESRDGVSSSLVTDETGSARFEALENGFYELRATAEGRQPVVEPEVRVIEDQIRPLRIELVATNTAIDELVVTGRARRADVFGGVSSSFFSRDELRNAVGSGSDVMRALDGLPGVASTGDFANFTVRGRGPRNNLIFVDGFPLDKVVHFDQSIGEDSDIEGGGRFSIFAPNSIAGAEFSPGGWGAAFGGRAGSLLQLEVVGGSPTPTASLRVDITGAELVYDGPSGFDDDTTLFFTARQFDFGRLFDQIDEGDIGSPELTDVILKTVTDINANNSIEFLAITAPEQFTRDIDNVLESEDFEDVSIVDTEQDLSLIGLTWRRLVGETGEWTNRLYVRDSDKTSVEGEAFPDLVAEGTPAALIPVNPGLLTLEESEREIGWRSDYRAQNRFGGFSAGLRAVQIDADFTVTLREDWNRYVYEAGDSRPPGQNFITWTPADIDSRYDASEVNYAAFVEQVFELGKLDVRTGLRFDRDGFSDQSLVSPRLSANYQWSPEVRLSATAGVFYESPRFLTRGSNPDNALLENERITHVSAGVERRFGGDWSVLVEAYYQQLDDLVVDEGRDSARATNSGDGTNAGVDVVVNRAFANGWSANATYSYNRNRIDDNNGRGSYRDNFAREHFFTVAARREINRRWQVAARWKFGTGRPDDAFIINDDVLGAGQPLRFSKEITARNAVDLENYHGLNLRVDNRSSLGGVDLVLFLDIINVYGGPIGQPPEFNPRTGRNVSEEDGAFPLIGIIFEKSW